MPRKRLKFNQAYKRDIKHLLFDIMFTDKTFMQIQNDHKTVNGRLFFTNLDKFDFQITEGRNKDEIINDKKLDDIFNYFFQRLELINLDIDEKKRLKK